MSQAETTVEILTDAIYITSLLVVVTPIYIYGIIKWYQFYNHFIVAKRFPLISTIIHLVSYINLFTSSIRFWGHYQRGGTTQSIGFTIDNFGKGFNQGAIFFVTGLILCKV